MRIEFKHPIKVIFAVLFCAFVFFGLIVMFMNRVPHGVIALIRGEMQI